ncbi:Variable surface protein Vir7-like protein [Plasmodium coatneyi]|uniref:Variable surface protein Vir7-like protein n=1 Tax=Plasmodium coatneyi TaxID=208452 RepID=A0A1B1E7I4_9APIC|nr:Variable surface protein Vir7-like protein [Plasmodium coatneyi]ANQ10965.1 Variable surface protein Vir7-like protein [Plasmodium coatneyi]
MAAGKGEPLTENNLGRLPSQSAYNELGGQTGACSSTLDDRLLRREERKLEEALTNYENVKVFVDEIVGAWCFIHKTKKVSDPTDPWCYWFYYWLGNTALQVSGKIFLSDFMNTVYNALEKVDVTHKCEKIGEHISKIDFNQIRTVYEYYRDFEAIRAQLSGSGYQCDEKYEEHLQDILKSYEPVHTKCNGGVYGEHCKEFQDMFTDDKYRDLLLPKNRTVVTVSKSMEQLPASSTANTALSTAIVPSTVATLLGLPAVGFLLYKVSIMKFEM